MPAKGSGIKSINTLRMRVSELKGPLDTRCWRWNGGLTGEKRPGIFLFDPAYGKQRVVSAARAGAILRKLEVPEGGRAWMRCMNRLCCNPYHVDVGTRDDFGAAMAASGKWRNNPIRTAILTGAIRDALSPLNMELVRQIRATGEPGPEFKAGAAWARELGLHRATISGVRTFKTWRETSPFSGL